MKAPRKLVLVPPPKPEIGDEEPPITEAEAREAEELRRALESGASPLAAELKAAWSPDALGDVDHDAILARVLDGAEDRATTVERVEAGRLRDELAAVEGAGSQPQKTRLESTDLAVALRAAHRPTSIDPERNELLIAAALAKKSQSTPRLRRIVAVTSATVMGAIALAAGVMLYFQTNQAPAGGPLAKGVSHPPPVAVAAALIPARSTQPLFEKDDRFPVQGGTSQRMDRIASARAADLRQNRFTAWGVK